MCSASGAAAVAAATAVVVYRKGNNMLENGSVSQSVSQPATTANNPSSTTWPTRLSSYIQITRDPESHVDKHVGRETERESGRENKKDTLFSICFVTIVKFDKQREPEGLGRKEKKKNTKKGSDTKKRKTKTEWEAIIINHIS